jgi:hypothetical protein
VFATLTSTDMRKIILYFLSIICSGFVHAQHFEWAKKMGGTINDDSRSVTVDAMGNVFTVGNFFQTGDFDPGAGVFNLTAAGAGNHDVFVSKLDASGNFLWAKQLGGTLDDLVWCIKTDAWGNAYIIGVFNGTADFDPGPGSYSLTPVGGYDIFICKLDASGDFVWAKIIGGTDYENYGAIAVDLSGNVYITGDFRLTADFDPGPGVFNMTTTGFVGSFVCKLDASGNFIWARPITGSYSVTGRSIKVDDSGFIYTTGQFQGTADFDPGAGTFNLSSSGSDEVYISKLDASGNFIWARRMGGTAADAGFSITVNTLGDIYTTGYFQGTADLDPGTGVYNLTTAGVHDIFISKLDATGSFIWAKQLGGASYDIGNSLDLDASGDVYTTGEFRGTVDFNPGAEVYNLTSTGQIDAFILKLDASGNFKWVKQIGGGNNSMGKSISVQTSGNVYTTGNFEYTTDFDPGPGVYNLTPTSLYSADVFVLKLACSTKASISSNSCDSYTSPSGKYIWTISGTYSDTIPNIAGCDSIITINLTINHSSSGTDVVTACDSYTWIDGITYTSSNNTATYTLTNITGCDSLVTLNLTLNHSSSGTDVVTACDSYTWIDGNTYTSSNNTATYTLTNITGCDSLVTLNLTLNHSSSGTDVVTACDSYTWIDGITYTSSNHVATHMLTNSTGCDSLVTLNLTIYSSPENNITQNGTTLTAMATGVSYQWLDCSNNFAPIAGETGQSFTATDNGNYAVEISQNGCSVISDCFIVTLVGVSENSFNHEIVLYPNPTDGKMKIDLGEEYSEIALTIRTIGGRVLQTTHYTNRGVIDIDLNVPPGVYFVILISDQKKAVFKVVKK